MERGEKGVNERFSPRGRLYIDTGTKFAWEIPDIHMLKKVVDDQHVPFGLRNNLHQWVYLNLALEGTTLQEKRTSRSGFFREHCSKQIPEITLKIKMALVH
jgi:hypothetical protein